MVDPKSSVIAGKAGDSAVFMLSRIAQIIATLALNRIFHRDLVTQACERSGFTQCRWLHGVIRFENGFVDRARYCAACASANVVAAAGAGGSDRVDLLGRDRALD